VNVVGSESNVSGDESLARHTEELRGSSRWSRRAFLGTTVATLTAFVSALLRRGLGPTASAAQTEEPSVAATPAAGATPTSPLGNVGPDLVVTPAPRLGQLQVVDEQRPVSAGVPNQGGELRLLLTAGNNENFSVPSFRQDFQIMASYLDPLVGIDPVTMGAVPWLAESWRIDRDATRITYRLRDGVLWHDGAPLVADDVVFSLYAYRDDFDSGVGNLFLNMNAAEADGDRTVVVTLSQPDPNWILNASSQFIFQRAQLVDHWESRPVGERTLSDFRWKDVTPVGTGPWQVDSRTDATVTFSRNANYWAGPPYADRLVLTVIEEPAARVASWVAGETDVLWPVSRSELTAAMETQGKVYVADTARVMFAAFNFDNPARRDPALLADINLRQALSLAIDRARYSAEIFGGFIQPERAGTVAQPWAYATGARNPPRDLATARQLLAEAGYQDLDLDGILESPTGEQLSLQLIVQDTASADLLALLASITTDLREIGVLLDVRPLGAGQFDETWMRTHQFDLIAYSYLLYPGFTDFDLYGTNWDIRTNPSGWNPGGYSNSEVDRFIGDMLVVDNSRNYRNQLHAMQRELNRDLFGLWFGFPRDLVLVSPEIRGFSPNKQWQTWDTRSLWRR
jgi:peptide/nickel transport system substrate-binding protein